jgi:hypothetical protein
MPYQAGPSSAVGKTVSSANATTHHHRSEKLTVGDERLETRYSFWQFGGDSKSSKRSLGPYYPTSTMRRHTLICLLFLPMLNRAADHSAIAASCGSAANRIIEAAMHDDTSYERLATLCDRIGNRLSGSESLLKAVKWSAEEMKKAGLTNVLTPPVMVPHWVRGRESAAILSPVEKPLTLC